MTATRGTHLAWSGGRELSAAGLGAVATEAEHRGGGIMSRLLTDALRAIVADGDDSAVLWGDRLRHAQVGLEPVGRKL